MLKVILKGHDYKYDIENLIYTFFDKKSVTFLDASEHSEGYTLINSLSRNDLVPDSICFTIQSVLTEDDEILAEKTFEVHAGSELSEIEIKKMIKTKMKLNIYDCLSERFPSRSKWGILVGIRPVKIIHELMDQGMAVEDIPEYLTTNYRIDEDKIQLLIDIAKRERPLIFPVETDKISLYVCIPFCPTKCLYCSFPSNPLNKKKKLVEPYLEALIHEIKVIGGTIREKGKTIDCVYIGGGTPTSLDESQTERLLAAIDTIVNADELVEYTVEAGRPDTITEGKLALMKHYGVDRICINPQSMNASTLKYIGRDHTPEDIEETFKLVEGFDFKMVNTDLIVGLGDEGIEEVRHTLNQVMKYKPENITIHTLAVKRSSRLNETIADHKLQKGDTVEEMMDFACETVTDADYVPYYMYRQKNMLANLENIGFAKVGHESIYNMRIMEERHTIIALGAGSVSKICFPEENRFERFSNSKGVEDYIARIDELIAKKQILVV